MLITNSLRVLVLCAGALVAALAQAQVPAAAPPAVLEVMPFDIPYGAPITLERARQVGDAAAAEARKRNWKMSIAVVGPAGELVFFQKVDGAIRFQLAPHFSIRSDSDDGHTGDRQWQISF